MQQFHAERLIYGFDPLCGWCFAFRPTMAAVTTAHSDLPIKLIYGGLVVGERVSPISTARAYLERGLEEVRRVSGVTAGARFYDTLLAAGTYISNSEPPCRAIYAVEQLAPAHAYAFADALPDAFYGQGLPLDDGQVLSELAAAYGVDPAAFHVMWQSAAARAGVQHAFAQARAAGIRTYPTLIYEHQGQRTLIGEGFLSPDEAVERIALQRRVTNAAS